MGKDSSITASTSEPGSFNFGFVEWLALSATCATLLGCIFLLTLLLPLTLHIRLFFAIFALKSTLLASAVWFFVRRSMPEVAYLSWMGRVVLGLIAGVALLLSLLWLGAVISDRISTTIVTSTEFDRWTVAFLLFASGCLAAVPSALLIAKRSHVPSWPLPVAAGIWVAWNFMLLVNPFGFATGRAQPYSMITLDEATTGFFFGAAIGTGLYTMSKLGGVR